MTQFVGSFCQTGKTNEERLTKQTWETPVENEYGMIPMKMLQSYLETKIHHLNSRGKDMTDIQAWNYAVGMIKVDGLEPTKEFKQYIEKEKRGEVTMEDVKRFLDKKYKVKQ